MKNKKQVLRRVAVAMMAFVMAFTLVGCGTKTLEQVINDDAKVKEQIESMAVGGLDVAITENQVVYTYTYDQTFKKEAVDAIKPEIEKMMSSTKSIYENMIKQLESATEIEGISIKVVYKNGDGSTIYENVYE